MILYEVSIVVDNDIYEEYLTWLDDHVQELLKLEGFSKAEIWCDQNQSNQIICHYHIESEKHYTDYIEIHSPKLRADGTRRFEGKFQIERRAARLVSRWSR